MPSSPCPRTDRKIWPMFSRCKMARTPGIFSAAAVSSLTTRPLAIVASTGTAYSIPGKRKSEVYSAFPLTFTGPSTRGVLRPIGETVGASSFVRIFAPSLASGCRGHLQGMRETAPGQLDFECVLTLRLGVAQRRFGCFAKVGCIGRLTDERRFGLGGAPGFGAHATQRHACPRHVPVRDRDHDSGRCQGEFVRCPIAQLQIHVLVSGARRRQRD